MIDSNNKLGECYQTISDMTREMYVRGRSFHIALYTIVASSVYHSRPQRRTRIVFESAHTCARCHQVRTRRQKHEHRARGNQLRGYVSSRFSFQDVRMDLQRADNSHANGIFRRWMREGELERYCQGGVHRTFDKLLQGRRMKLKRNVVDSASVRKCELPHTRTR